ncbi:hypothetical protein O7599_35695 [Streptomyces sp. WMMC500]|uniref:sulfotransferase-like domain-containing protein n=1 Tax=Streptomyces sp. WMMC500 TaxID=3015154 RepID=UPI00248BD680|nr:hypothetical protein [Streptomyces sp. WMMC500]WBB60779.1 hypothetical protein O7599_35695 [Streptomyces sp. WMMC500]
MIPGPGRRPPRRIALWSGPRSLSTALLRSWESRADTAVSDEPFYAYFLTATGADRPNAGDSLDSQPHDWRVVLGRLLGEVPDRRPIWFQKHHAMHLLPEVPRSWIAGMTNCFLVRHPARVAVSYARIRPGFTAEDLGFRQLRAVFGYVTEHCPGTPPVLNAADLARDPPTALKALCAALGVDFTEDMLAWPPGRHEHDPSLGDPWYRNVQGSSGYLPYTEDEPQVPAELRGVVDACMDDYLHLDRHRIHC